MRPDGTLIGTHWGPLSAIGRQPRRGHANEVLVHTPTEPWGSHRLPHTLTARDPRRTLFRSLLRRAEGVPVASADGRQGVVTDVLLAALGFDFWAEELAVTVGDGRWRVPVGHVRQIDVRPPRILLGSCPPSGEFATLISREDRLSTGRRPVEIKGDTKAEDVICLREAQ